MSFDLMVFDPDLAPAASKVGEWYGEVMDASAEKDLEAAFDPASAQSDRLRAFYNEMRARFPAMNGPDQTDDFDNEQVTGYDFHPGFIYMDFRWSTSKAAAEVVSALAKQHGLGLYDPQGDEVVLTGSGRMRSTPWWRRLFGG